MIVVDTHVLVWSVIEPRQIGRKTARLIERWWAAGRVAAASISFWEVALLVARRRINLPLSVDEWRNQLLAAGLIELPLDGSAAIRAVELDGVGPDPADRLIAATALAQRAALVTADERLLAWRHPLERHDARL